MELGADRITNFLQKGLTINSVESIFQINLTEHPIRMTVHGGSSGMNNHLQPCGCGNTELKWLELLRNIAVVLKVQDYS